MTAKTARKQPRETVASLRNATHQHSSVPRQRLPPAAPAPAVVGIAAPAQTMAYVCALLKALPAQPGKAIVVLMNDHVPHVSALKAMLRRHSPMPVSLIRSGLHMRADRVYLAPATRLVSLAHGVLQTQKPRTAPTPMAAVDHFLNSLDDEPRSRSRAVILAGAPSGKNLPAPQALADRLLRDHPPATNAEDPPHWERAVLHAPSHPRKVTPSEPHGLPAAPRPAPHSKVGATRTVRSRPSPAPNAALPALSPHSCELAALVAGDDIAIVDLDGEGRVRHFCPAARAAFQLRDADVGRMLAELVPSLDALGLRALIDAALQHGQAERTLQDDSGHWHALKLRRHRADDANSSGVLIAWIGIDTIRHYSAEIVNAITRPLLLLDPQQRVLLCNPAFCHTFGMSQAHIEHRRLVDLGNGQWRAAALQLLREQELPERRRIRGFRFEHDTADAGTRSFLLDAQHLSRDGGVPAILLLFEDVTEREATVAEHLRAATEREARGLAQDLHDLTGASLSSLAIELDRATQLLQPSAHEALKPLRAAQDQIRMLGQDMQDLARRIHPAVLDALGLSKALRGECETFEQQHATPVTLSTDGPVDGAPAPVALCLYRIAQEALRNVARHARAAHVSVSLEAAAGEVRLEVRDDGAGFDLARAAERQRLGLVLMRERSHAVHGRLVIHSAPGAGTSVRVTVPLPADTPSA